MVTTNHDEDDNDKDAGDSDEELMAAADRDFKRQARLSIDHFEKLLEAMCSNHTYHIKHKLKECTTMKNYMTMRNLARNMKPEGDSAGKVATPFPEEKAVMSIYGRPAPHESCRKLKLIGQVVNSVGTGVLEFLHWSESMITFDWTDHLDSNPKPGRFPSSSARWSGEPGSPRPSWMGAAAPTSCTSIPLRGWGSPRTSSRAAHTHFTEWYWVSSPPPLGRITLSVTFGDASNYRIEMLTFEVVDFSGP
jgi:hypothetical protein